MKPTKANLRELAEAILSWCDGKDVEYTLEDGGVGTADFSIWLGLDVALDSVYMFDIKERKPTKPHAELVFHQIVSVIDKAMESLESPEVDDAILFLEVLIKLYGEVK